MAKDYFQDIVPPSENSPRRVAVTPQDDSAIPPQPIETAAPLFAPVSDADTAAPAPQERSIRNISMPNRPTRSRPLDDMRDMREVPPLGMGMPRGPRRPSRIWMWAAAILSILILAALVLVAFRDTVVRVTPRTHSVVFDEASLFTSYPEASAASGMLVYTVRTVELEDSEVVSASGTVHAEDRASGTITVFNDYSAAPVKLVKTTRFEANGGLIYRVPADVSIPGKAGAVPGQVQVTVVADQPGEKYNIGPVARFTLPGLKSSDMYTKVYGSSSAAMSGGFAGERPGIASDALESTIALIRDRLEKKAHEAALAQSDDAQISFADLIQIEYQDMPSTPETGGGARIHQKAIVRIPVFARKDFSGAIARSVSTDADGGSVNLTGDSYTVHQSGTTSILGTEPLQFSLQGEGLLVWSVDSAALSTALAGRDQTAFQSIVTGFPAIQEAKARIEPFWSSSFPKDSSDIKIKIELPKAK